MVIKIKTIYYGEPSMMTLNDIGIAFAKYRRELGVPSGKAVKYPKPLRMAVQVFCAQHPKVGDEEIAAILHLGKSTVGKWRAARVAPATGEFLPVTVLSPTPVPSSLAAQGLRIECGKLTVSFGSASRLDEVKAVIELLLAG